MHSASTHVKVGSIVSHISLRYCLKSYILSLFYENADIPYCLHDVAV